MNPELVSAKNLKLDQVGEFAWDSTLNTNDLLYSEQGLRATWQQEHMAPGDVAPRIWVPVQSLARFHSGDFSWEFQVEHIGDAQIGIGFMLDWTIGPDWGFYGYLGSSSSAWAYDPTSGDVVIDTRSIEGGLPVFSSGQGLVRVEAHLPRERAGLVRFVIEGRNSQAIELPEGAVLVPAACFLGLGQTVILQNLSRDALDTAAWGMDVKPELSPKVEQPEPKVKQGLWARVKSKIFGV